MTSITVARKGVPQFSGWKRLQGEDHVVMSEQEARNYMEYNFVCCPNCHNAMDGIYDYGDMKKLQCPTPGCRTEVNVSRHY